MSRVEGDTELAWVPTLDEKVVQLKERIRAMGSVIVAFSAGSDSTATA